MTKCKIDCQKLVVYFERTHNAKQTAGQAIMSSKVNQYKETGREHGWNNDGLDWVADNLTGAERSKTEAQVIQLSEADYVKLGKLGKEADYVKLAKELTNTYGDKWNFYPTNYLGYSNANDCVFAVHKSSSWEPGMTEVVAT